jgi:hypothetical protein
MHSTNEAVKRQVKVSTSQKSATKCTIIQHFPRHTFRQARQAQHHRDGDGVDGRAFHGDLVALSLFLKGRSFCGSMCQSWSSRISQRLVVVNSEALGNAKHCSIPGGKPSCIRHLRAAPCVTINSRGFNSVRREAGVESFTRSVRVYALDILGRQSRSTAADCQPPIVWTIWPTPCVSLVSHDAPEQQDYSTSGHFERRNSHWPSFQSRVTITIRVPPFLPRRIHWAV